MDKSNTRRERKEMTGGNDGGGRFIRENQSWPEQDVSQTARLLGQEMDIKPEKHLVHTPGSVLDSLYLMLLLLFCSCCVSVSLWSFRDCPGKRPSLWIFSRFYGKVDVDWSKDVCEDSKANGQKAVWSKRRVKNLPVKPDGGVKRFI